MDQILKVEKEIEQLRLTLQQKEEELDLLKQNYKLVRIYTFRFKIRYNKLNKAKLRLRP